MIKSERRPPDFAGSGRWHVRWGRRGAHCAALSWRACTRGAIACWSQAVCRPLLPVGGQPLLTHALDWIRSAGIRAATICGNSDTGRIRSCLGDGNVWGVDLDYSEDVMPRGPAGCVRDAAMDSDAAEVVVVDGTIVPRVDLKALAGSTRACPSSCDDRSRPHQRTQRRGIGTGRNLCAGPVRGRTDPSHSLPGHQGIVDSHALSSRHTGCHPRGSGRAGPAGDGRSIVPEREHVGAGSQGA